MGRKRTPGLRKRGQCWHIEKQVKDMANFSKALARTALKKRNGI